MVEIPFYSILDQQRWDRTSAEVQGTLRKHGTRRNAPCPCGSGKKLKVCCGPAASGTPEGWLDEHGQLRAGLAAGLDPDQRRDVLHVARMERAHRLLDAGGTLPELGRGATEWAALAGVLRRATDEADASRQALRRVLGLPHDLCLDYRRIVHDLVLLSRKHGDLDTAIDAQRWWVDFLEDFGKLFGLRVEAVEALHALLVEASKAQATEESRHILFQSIFGPPPADRTALYAKLRSQEPGTPEDGSPS